MKRILVTLSSLLPLACSSPQGIRTLIPFEILGPNIVRVGESLKISNVQGSAKLMVTVTNVKTGSGRTREVVIEQAAVGSVALDGSMLPDLGQTSKVQTFDVRIDNPAAGASVSKAIYVVADEGVKSFPHVLIAMSSENGPNLPPGKAPMVADPSLEGVDRYLQQIISDWKLDQPSVQKAPILRGDVTIPDWLRSMPGDVGLVEVRLGAKFQKYLVPELHSPSGQVEVYEPAQMSFVLTQTNPAVLVSLTAIPPGATR